MKKSSKKSLSEAPILITDKNINIKQISNGFVVSTWTDKGEKAKFAKTKKELKTIISRLV